MIAITDIKQCCGCTACMAVCPKQAITMKPDEMGFLYPVVEKEKCVDCGLCNQVCAFNDQYDRSNSFETPLVFGAYHKEQAQVERSQSGGLFYTIALYIISSGGVVYGASFTSVYHVCHKRVTTIKELEALRGAKYVQSDLEGAFSNIVKDLEDGKMVLFSGTGCQAAGLRSLIIKRRVNDANLIICDIVCHGVPSPFVWKENVKWIEERHKNKVIEAIFRDKNLYGWHSSTSSYKLENGKKVVSNKYNFAFGLGYINRKSCDVCHFANTKRPSDITIGDFWGLEKINASLDAENKGVSLVLINTAKGVRIFDLVKENLVFFESDIASCQQPNLRMPSTPSPYRDDFKEKFLTAGYEKALNAFPELQNKSILDRIYGRIKSVIKN